MQISLITGSDGITRFLGAVAPLISSSILSSLFRIPPLVRTTLSFRQRREHRLLASLTRLRRLSSGCGHVCFTATFLEGSHFSFYYVQYKFHFMQYKLSKFHAYFIKICSTIRRQRLESRGELVIPWPIMLLIIFFFLILRLLPRTRGFQTFLFLPPLFRIKNYSALPSSSEQTEKFADQIFFSSSFHFILYEILISTPFIILIILTLNSKVSRQSRVWSRAVNAFKNVPLTISRRNAAK